MMITSSLLGSGYRAPIGSTIDLTQTAASTDLRAGVRIGRREERSAQIRADLLGAAERMLAHKGVDRTTISDITSEAGLGFGTFYNYFASKEELYQELVLNGLKLLVERIDERCSRTDDHRQRLRIIAEEAADFAADHSDLFLLLTTNADVHTATHEGVEGLAASLKRWLRQGFDDGAFQPIDPDIVVKAIIGMYSLVLRPLARDAGRRREIKSALTRLIQGAVIGDRESDDGDGGRGRHNRRHEDGDDGRWSEKIRLPTTITTSRPS